MQKYHLKNLSLLHNESSGENIDIGDILLKALYTKCDASINQAVEKCKAFPLKSGTRQGCPLCPYFFNIVPDVLTR